MVRGEVFVLGRKEFRYAASVCLAGEEHWPLGRDGAWLRPGLLRSVESAPSLWRAKRGGQKGGGLAALGTMPPA